MQMYANHAKKRPHNLTFCRFYDGHLLDLLEVGIDGFRPIQDFAANGSNKVQSANKARPLAAGGRLRSRPAQETAHA